MEQTQIQKQQEMQGFLRDHQSSTTGQRTLNSERKTAMIEQRTAFRAIMRQFSSTVAARASSSSSSSSSSGGGGGGGAPVAGIVRRYLRQFVRSVHPDLFASRPDARATNEASLQAVNALVAALPSATPPVSASATAASSAAELAPVEVRFELLHRTATPPEQQPLAHVLSPFAPLHSLSFSQPSHAPKIPKVLPVTVTPLMFRTVAHTNQSKLYRLLLARSLLDLFAKAGVEIADADIADMETNIRALAGISAARLGTHASAFQQQQQQQQQHGGSGADPKERFAKVFRQTVAYTDEAIANQAKQDASRLHREQEKPQQSDRLASSYPLVFFHRTLRPEQRAALLNKLHENRAALNYTQWQDVPILFFDATPSVASASTETSAASSTQSETAQNTWQGIRLSAAGNVVLVPHSFNPAVLAKFMAMHASIARGGALHDHHQQQQKDAASRYNDNTHNSISDE